MRVAVIITFRDIIIGPVLTAPAVTAGKNSNRTVDLLILFQRNSPERGGCPVLTLLQGPYHTSEKEWLFRRLGGVHAKVGYWALGFVAPLVLFSLYFGLIALFGGVAWTVHLAAGAPFIAGLYGLLASLLAIRPDFLGDWGAPREV